MTITEAMEGEKLVLFVEGHVDTPNAADLQQKILLAFQKNPNIILDLSKLKYVSSSGLRAFLIGQKTAQSKQGSFVLRNATDDVKKLFALVGFDKILKFE